MFMKGIETSLSESEILENIQSYKCKESMPAEEERKGSLLQEVL